MVQQTAVEWLYNHLFPKQLDGFSDEEWGKIDKAFEQAKQMEKEQIINAFDIACEDEDRIGEEYYNETYGGQFLVEQYAWDNPILSRKDVYDLFNDVFKDKKMEGAYQISASKQVYQFNTRLRELAKQKAIDLTKDTTTSPNTQNK